MPTVELSDGTSVVLQDPGTITGAQCEDALGVAGDVLGVDPSSIEDTQWLRLVAALKRATIVVLAQSWSRKEPIDADTVGALPARLLRPLNAMVGPAVDEVMELMRPSEPDPKSDSSS